MAATATRHTEVAIAPKLIIASALAAFAMGALSWGPRAQATGPEGALDARAWELVSPAAKNGGEVQAPDAKGAGGLQASTAGGALAFGSATSFGAAQGAPPLSQYL